MKALARFVPCWLALGLMAGATSQGKEYLVQLRGVIDVEGFRAALLELDYALPGPANEQRVITKLMHEGEMIEPQVGRSPRVELLGINAPQMRITVRENGVENTYAIPSGPVSWPGTNRLALANASITDVVDLLSLLTDRIVLFHPNNQTMAPEIQCHWTNSITTKLEAARALENAFHGRDTETVLRGNHFLILSPIAVTNEITRAWVSPAAGGPEVAPFVARSPTEAIAKYSELTGRSLAGRQSAPETWFYLRTFKPVSKAEAVDVIKTILDWGGCRVVDGKDKTFALESRSALRRNP
jgi:hypothetical protein